MAHAAYWMYCMAQRRAQAQAGQGGTPGAPLVANGCPAKAEMQVKIEDAVVDKKHVAGPLHARGPGLSQSTRPVHTDIQPVITPSRAVFCGERESSLPPGYRLSKTTVPVEQSNGSPEVAPAPLNDEIALEALSAGLTSSAPSAPLDEPPADVPLDALNALSDTLGAPEPVPEPPKIDPSEIINEGPLVTEEDAVLVGEREDSIPPEYRLTENGTDLLPQNGEEKPSMDSGEALDILSGDFSAPAAPAAVPKQPCLDVLDILDGELAAPAQAAEADTDIETSQTSSDETVISCGGGSSAAMPSDIPAQAMVDDAPAIADLSGNLVSAQS